ncbi:tumor necrosis factor receptor superfamily member 14-like isoform X3 [Myotis yumanensis]|uniref:tumor necrosis factor receptor superfamily member 14-like isoform X3 n=1 Tax=Myotis yumanensis TaxID=159337 RepID=UPI0038CFE483
MSPSVPPSICPAVHLSRRPESRGRGQGMRVPGVDMQPLPGWGPPPCSPTPAADVLRLALNLLLLTALPCALGMPSCKEVEFPTGAMCCPKCRPGYLVKEACGEFTGTVCEPCTRGTYTPHLNGLPECLPCRVCDPGLGQVTRWNCSTRTNTLCGCGRGHFCVRQDGDACVQCRPHSVCRPGQWVRETGTEWQDTLCEDCQPGTFSAGGTLAACTPWTKCSGPFAWEATPGTNRTDVTCSSGGPVIIIIIVSVILVITVISVLVRMSIRDRRKTRLSSGIASCPHPRGDRGAGRKEQASGPAGLPSLARRHHGARGGDSIPVPSEGPAT